MKSTIKEILLIGGTLFLFVLIFKLLQNTKIYSHTLGKISHNYTCTGPRENLSIQNANVPYIYISEPAIDHWDAELYRDIRDDLYEIKNPLLWEKAAFYPLFPLVWKLCITHSPKFIVILNYLIFAAGLLILMHNSSLPQNKRLQYLLLALILPTAVNFYLPYAESLFVLTFAFTVWAIHRNSYPLYFASAFLFCITRPAAIIYAAALAATDFVYFLRHRNSRFFLSELEKKLRPCIAGYLFVTLFQYYYTGSFTAYFDALSYWPTESGWFNTITDWSVEGFGMTVFSIFFVSIPALIYCVIWAAKNFSSEYKTEAPPLLTSDTAFKRTYLLNLSLVFLAGNLVYTFLTTGNALNGFSRYSMAVPFFYIVLFELPEILNKTTFKKKIIFYSLSLASMSLFLYFVIYGGNRFRFEYFGMYLFLSLAIFILIEQHLPKWLNQAGLVALIIPCLLWQTYLFNMFLSNAWIFT